MNILINNSRRIIFCIISVVTVIIIYAANNGLGGGYDIKNDLVEDTYIAKGDTRIIRPTIVDWVESSHFIVGLRLNVQNYECNNGGAYVKRLLNEVSFFILDYKSDKVSEYNKKIEFLNALKKLSIDKSVQLDFSKGQEIYKKKSIHYANIDWDECSIISTSKIKGVTHKSAGVNSALKVGSLFSKH